MKNKKLIGIIAATGIVAVVAIPVYNYVFHNHLRPNYEETVDYLVEQKGLSEERAEQYANLGLDSLFPSQLEALHKIVERFTPENIGQIISNTHLDLNHFTFRVEGDTDENPWFTGDKYEAWTSESFSYIAMQNSAYKKKTLEDALKWKKIFAGKEFNEKAFLSLIKYEVPLADSQRISADLKLMEDRILDSEDAYEIIKLYAEETGTTASDRKDYLWSNIHDPDIKLLADNGVKPYMVGNLSFGNNSKVWWVIDQVKEGKLNGDLYEKSMRVGIKDGEVVFALNNGYELQEALQWNSLDFDVPQMHNAKKKGITFDIATNGRERNLTPEQIINAFELDDFVEQNYKKLVK